MTERFTRISSSPASIVLGGLAVLAIMVHAATAAAAADGAAPGCSAPQSLNNAASTRGELRYRFMGTTTLLFEDGETQILIDGFFSRPPLARAGFGRVRPNCARIEEGLEKAGITRQLRAIFVAHAHVDHVLDAPEIARLTGAELVGSRSVRNVALGHGLAPRQIREASDRVACGYGRFRVTPIVTPHTIPNVAWGSVSWRVPRDSWAQFYRARDSLAFLIEHGHHSLLVYPAAAYRRGLLNDVRADIIFLATSGLGRRSDAFASNYFAEVVGMVEGQIVYPVHWDDFGRPLSDGLRPMPLPFDNASRGLERVRNLARDHGVRLEELPLFEPVVAPMPSGRRAVRPADSTPPCASF